MTTKCGCKNKIPIRGSYFEDKHLRVQMEGLMDDVVFLLTCACWCSMIRNMCACVRVFELYIYRHTTSDQHTCICHAPIGPRWTVRHTCIQIQTKMHMWLHSSLCKYMILIYTCMHAHIWIRK